MIDDSFPPMGDVQPSYLGSQSQSPDKLAMDVPKPANDNKNLDLGTGGFDPNKAWNSLIKQMNKPKLEVIKGGK